MSLKKLREVKDAFGKLYELLADSGIETSNNISLQDDGMLVIAVLQRGHILVGMYSQSGYIASLSKASVIRRWGTSEGLGELAYKGPLENTKLDKCPDVTFHIREAIMIMTIAPVEGWKEYIRTY